MATTKRKGTVAWRLLRNLLLDVDDDECRERVLNLFVSTYEATLAQKVDVCLFATQRTANLYIAMTEYGLPHFQCQIVSGHDAALQSPEGGWAGKRIVIIDDSMRRGTGLALLYNEMVAAVGPTGSVSISVATIYENVAHSSILEYLGLESEPKVPFSRARRFSEDISSTVYQALIPSTGDYFTTKALEMPPSRLPQGLVVPGWQAFDVTPIHLARGTSFTLSYLPENETLIDCMKRLDSVIANISGYISLVKVRIYGRILGNSSAVRAVPILLVDNLADSSVKKFLLDIDPFVGHWSGKISPNSWAPATRRRVFQLFLSAAVALQFRTDVEKTGVSYFDELTTVLDEQVLVANFGSTMANYIHRALNVLVANAGLLESDRAEPLGVAPERSVNERMIFDRLSTVEAENCDPSILQLLELAKKRGSVEQLTSEFVAAVQHAFVAMCGEDQFLQKSEQGTLSLVSLLELFPSKQSRESQRGITLHELAGYFTKSEDVKRKLEFLNQLSLAIDVLLDAGIILAKSVEGRGGAAVARRYLPGDNAHLVSEQLSMMHR